MWRAIEIIINFNNRITSKFCCFLQLVNSIATVCDWSGWTFGEEVADWEACGNWHFISLKILRKFLYCDLKRVLLHFSFLKKVAKSPIQLNSNIVFKCTLWQLTPTASLPTAFFPFFQIQGAKTIAKKLLHEI